MTTEDVIQDVVGIKPGAGPVTPMDYLECKVCMERFAAHEVAKEVEAYKERLKQKLEYSFIDRSYMEGIEKIIDTTK